MPTTKASSKRVVSTSIAFLSGFHRHQNWGAWMKTGRAWPPGPSLEPPLRTTQKISWHSFLRHRVYFGLFDYIRCGDISVLRSLQISDSYLNRLPRYIRKPREAHGGWSDHMCQWRTVHRVLMHINSITQMHCVIKLYQIVQSHAH